MIVSMLILSLSVFVPVPIRHGWAWGKCEDQFPTCEEPLADLGELPRVLRSYGKAVAQIIKPAYGDQFNVTAFHSQTQAVQGRDEWHWDADIHIFRPSGEPLVIMCCEDARAA